MGRGMEAQDWPLIVSVRLAASLSHEENNDSISFCSPYI